MKFMIGVPFGEPGIQVILKVVEVLWVVSSVKFVGTSGIATIFAPFPTFE